LDLKGWEPENYKAREVRRKPVAAKEIELRTGIFVIEPRRRNLTTYREILVHCRPTVLFRQTRN